MTPLVHRDRGSDTGTRSAQSRLSVDLVPASSVNSLERESRVLFATTFGAHPHPTDDPRAFHVELEPLGASDTMEVWHGDLPVECGDEGPIRWTTNGEILFASLALPRSETHDIEGASHRAYRRLIGFCRETGFGHLWRVWNYIGDINDGEGDQERYRRFCVGRASALEELGFGRADYPAATAVGALRARHGLVLHLVAGRTPGLHIQNPRQTDPFLYPPAYGPKSPTFSRATLVGQVGAKRLLISGTASIVGHVSTYPGDVAAQLEEILRNLDRLLREVAAWPQLETTPQLDQALYLKIYLRNGAVVSAARRYLEQRLGLLPPQLFLRSDLCRRDLLVEIEAAYSC